MTDPQTQAEQMATIRASAGADGAAPQTLLVTQRSAGISEPVIGSTPRGFPDVLVKPLTISWRLFVRTVRTYLQAFVGFLITAGFTGQLAPGATAVDLSTFRGVLVAAAVAALVPAIMSLLTNALILFTRLDESHPDVMA